MLYVLVMSRLDMLCFVMVLQARKEGRSGGGGSSVSSKRTDGDRDRARDRDRDERDKERKRDRWVGTCKSFFVFWVGSSFFALPGQVEQRCYLLALSCLLAAFLCLALLLALGFSERTDTAVARKGDRQQGGVVFFSGVQDEFGCVVVRSNL